SRCRGRNRRGRPSRGGSPSVLPGREEGEETHDGKGTEDDRGVDPGPGAEDGHRIVIVAGRRAPGGEGFHAGGLVRRGGAGREDTVPAGHRHPRWVANAPLA